MSFIILLCILLGPVLFLLLTIWWKQRKALKRLKDCNVPIRRLPPIWFVFIKYLLSTDRSFNLRERLFQYFCSRCHLYKKEGIFGFSIAGNINVHIFKPEHIEIVLNNSTVLNKGWIYKAIQPWLGNGLVTRSGKTWRPRRKLLTPSFHFKILDNFQIVFNKHSFVLIDRINKELDQSWIDILPLLSLCTLDIIAETAMGVEIGAQKNEDSEYVKAVHRIVKTIPIRYMQAWLWPDVFFYLTSVGREFRRCVNFVHRHTEQVILECKKEMEKDMENGKEYDLDSENVYLRTKRRAFLNLLLYHHLYEETISLDDIREEVDTFMFAGHDTTSTAVSWVLYNLGQYQDIQQKVYDELYDVFGYDKERHVTAEDIKKMKYLDCVIKESLRIFPSVPIIGRENDEDLKLNEEITIPKKSFIVIEIYSIHHNPEFYSNPEIFDPDRFLPENSIHRHSYAFVPFSAGPRNCIGQRYAMMEEKTILINILRHFHVRSLDPRDKIILCAEIILHPINKLRLQFMKR